MHVRQDICVGCGECVPSCPVGAIGMQCGAAEIDQERCVECGVCFRNAVCPAEALVQPDLEYPRLFRRWFSDNTVKIPTVASLGSGRGVDEVKTNDVNGYYKRGDVGLILEPGRPAVSASMRDVQKLLTAFYAAGFALTARSPMSAFVFDAVTGALKPELLNERVLSCSLEFKTTYDRLPELLKVLQGLQGQLDTVVCAGLIARVEEGTLPGLAIARQCGCTVLPNAKVNIGLGRPLCED